MRWALWILGGLVLAGGSAAFLIVWWKLGDRWADHEHRKFGRGRAGVPDPRVPEVIEDPGVVDRASDGGRGGASGGGSG